LANGPYPGQIAVGDKRPGDGDAIEIPLRELVANERGILESPRAQHRDLDFLLDGTRIVGVDALDRGVFLLEAISDEMKDGPQERIAE
jgi:hypothetical protein